MSATITAVCRGAAQQATTAILAAAAATILLALSASSARAAVAAPAWSIESVAAPTHFIPGDETGDAEYGVHITNSGAQATDESPLTLVDRLPTGLKVGTVRLVGRDADDSAACSSTVASGAATVTCDVTLGPGHILSARQPGQDLTLSITVALPPDLSGPLINRVEASGAGAPLVSTQSENTASAEPAETGFEYFHAEVTDVDGAPNTRADSHPYQYTTAFAVNTALRAERKALPTPSDVKDIEVGLPPGLIGNPTVLERCTAREFNTKHVIGRNEFANGCPAGATVGLVEVQQIEGGVAGSTYPLFNLVPPKGMPAQFGFEVLGLPIYIDTKVRAGGDYGVTAYLENVTEAERIGAARVMLWGTPGDPSHNAMRGDCGLLEEGSCPSGLPSVKPFFRLPSSCEVSAGTSMSFDTWLDPGVFVDAVAAEPTPTGCDEPDFSPSITAKPSTGVADSPSGLHVDLHLPQAAHEDPEGLGEADLRDASVTLPEGFVVNPASAGGLVGCSEAQVGYLGVKEGRQRFTPAAAECPDASKIGTVEVDTPLVDHPLPGAVFLARQTENPFGGLLAIYITVNDPVSGVVVKLPGEVRADPLTGQLTTTVQQTPQLPFEDFKLDFFEGSRAPLRTPALCGTYTTLTSLTPWTAPASGPPATPSDSFTVTSAPGGGACPVSVAAEPNTPSFQAGAADPTAGVFSPLTVNLERADDSQNLSQIVVTLPPGASGRLAGVPQCTDAQIAAAQGRDHPGEGAAEQSNPSCPSSSMIGTATVGAGAGPDPFYATGRVYLAGPYKGAPFSLAIITPAVAGPFDLGTVVVRAGLYVNPSTAQVTTKSDPIPSILQGIPLDVRSITVTVDRPGFIVNPTSCNPLTITGEEVSTLGQVASLSGRFQVGSCQNLKFTPQFTVSTTGATSKAKGASLSVKVAYPTGSLGTQANIGRVDLQLPKQLPARLSTLQKACTEAQFNTNPAGCPTASMIGTAKAITPLLSSPLTGPAILVSHGGAAFPDVEFLLQGEGVLVILDGKTQIKKGITYSHFETVPDQPITTFETTFPQGPYSVLATDLPASAKNSLCGQALTLPTTLTAQNGAIITQNTKATVTGCAKTKILTRAQKLTIALKACHKKPKGSKRKACERQAHKKYGPLKKKRTKK
ncbi:MAG: hypothetical protein WB709_13230 [Solirubrobacteraceae bacterium]